MKIFVRSTVAATVIALGAVGFAGTAGAAAPACPGGHGSRPAPAVFVQTDNTAGNQVVAYSRATDGVLTPEGTYATGGLGGVLSGSVVDHLASEGSLTYDQQDGLLLAVNAGSNTVSVFGVDGHHLVLRQVVGSGGTFPVSVAVHGNLVYVLNAEDGGSVQGYFVAFGHLVALGGSTRALGLDPTATPQFVNTPGQVAFSPDGRQLIVTTKANGSDIDVFGVGFSGGLSAAPVVNAEPGAVPFGVTFDPAGHLVVAEAGTDAVATFDLHWNGTVTPIDTASTGQAATCWIASARGFYYASNAGSASLSAYTSTVHGQLAPAGQTTTDPGTVDAAASPEGRHLYVQTGGNGVVDEFNVNTNGSLTEIGSVTVPGAVGGEGIVAV
jgi:6-phosphogluconolactonase (cycloisomerase 2 family)